MDKRPDKKFRGRINIENKILIGIFVPIFLIGMVFTYGFAKSTVEPEMIVITTSTTIPEQANVTAAAVGLKAVNYLNRYFNQQGFDVTLNSVIPEGNIYHLEITIGDTDYDSYATKDGRLLFPSALIMDEVPPGI